MDEKSIKRFVESIADTPQKLLYLATQSLEVLISHLFTSDNEWSQNSIVEAYKKLTKPKSSMGKERPNRIEIPSGLYARKLDAKLVTYLDQVRAGVPEEERTPLTPDMYQKAERIITTEKWSNGIEEEYKRKYPERLRRRGQRKIGMAALYAAVIK